MLTHTCFDQALFGKQIRVKNALEETQCTSDDYVSSLVHGAREDALGVRIVTDIQSKAKTWLMGPAAYTCAMLSTFSMTFIPVLLANLVVCIGIAFGLIVNVFTAVVIDCLHYVLSAQRGRQCYYFF